MTRFRDAHPSCRCRATVRLKDRTHAQCGRRYDESYRGNPHWRLFCRQHQEMVFAGKAVQTFAAAPEEGTTP